MLVALLRVKPKPMAINFFQISSTADKEIFLHLYHLIFKEADHMMMNKLTCDSSNANQGQKEALINF